MNNKKFGAFSSVDDPQKFSQTWSGIFGIIGTILTALAAMKGVDTVVANEQIKAVTDAGTIILSSGVAIYQGSQALIGAVKKISAWFVKSA